MPRPSRKLLLLLLPVLAAPAAIAVPPVPRVQPPPRVPVPPPPARVLPHAPAPLPAPPGLPQVERVVPPRPHAGRPVPPPVHVQPLPGAPGGRVFGYRHPPREHGDREGYRWIPGRNGHEGRWAPHHRPGRHYVWVPGHWRGDLWINGHWARPNRR